MHAQYHTRPLPAGPPPRFECLRGSTEWRDACVRAHAGTQAGTQGWLGREGGRTEGRRKKGREGKGREGRRDRDTGRPPALFASLLPKGPDYSPTSLPPEGPDYLPPPLRLPTHFPHIFKVEVKFALHNSHTLQSTQLRCLFSLRLLTKMRNPAAISRTFPSLRKETPFPPAPPSPLPLTLFTGLPQQPPNLPPPPRHPA